MDSPSNAPLPAASAGDVTGSYLDFGGLGKLKGQARTDAKSATRETAQQFEAMFLQMMMKSMRDASPKSDLVESAGKDTFEAMFDKEVSVSMAKRNTLGIADLLVKHMPDTAVPPVSTAAMLEARNNQNKHGMALHPEPAKGMSLQAPAPALAALPRTGLPMPLLQRLAPLQGGNGAAQGDSP
jgi:flagellar protein FlgJ